MLRRSRSSTRRGVRPEQNRPSSQPSRSTSTASTDAADIEQWQRIREYLATKARRHTHAGQRPAAVITGIVYGDDPQVIVSGRLRVDHAQWVVRELRRLAGGPLSTLTNDEWTAAETAVEVE